MKLLVILNNHNSFGILDLCAELRHYEPSLEVTAVCSKEFFRANEERIAKYGIALELLSDDAVPPAAVQAGTPAGPMRESGGRTGTGGPRRWIAAMAAGLSSTSLYAAAREWRIVRRLGIHQRRATALLERLKTDVVLSLSDRSHDYVESSLLWAARALHVPIVLPYVAQFDIDASLQYRAGADGKPFPELRPFRPFSLYKLWSFARLRDQIYKGIFFQAPFILNAARRCGTLSRYPWWVGNGLSDVVCVDSQHTADQYAANRVDRHKIAIVGHVQYDRIFRSYQRRAALHQQLVEQYQFDPRRAMLVLSVPQYAEQGFLPWEEHWLEIEAIVGNAAAAGQNLLLSLHPRADASRYGYLAERFGCRIVAESLADIVGAADVFLASNSTTLVWSVLCGIPTIALKSPVRFLYTHLASIRRVDVAAQLPAAIADILASPAAAFEPDWKSLSRDMVFDGRYNRRFLALLRQACTA